MDIADLQNPFCKSATPIPDINHIENTDSKPNDIDSAKKPKKAKLL